MDTPRPDLALVGGRVIDPETGLDAVHTVEVTGGRITAIGDQPTQAATVLDASGLIVAPGFVDLHSHAQTLAGHRLQALDGVTTALELEVGVPDVATALSVTAEEGRPINYGFAAGWAGVRMHVMLGTPMTAVSLDSLNHLGDRGWQGAATPAELDRILGLVQAQLDAGGLGVGVLAGYAQGTTPEEYTAVARLAAQADAPTFTHARDLVEIRPDVLVDGAEEIVRTAAETGAHMHYCHINSTSTRHVDRVHHLIERAQSEGSRVTTEAYPYGSGMTGIGAQFIHPDVLDHRGLVPTDLMIPQTGEVIADVERLAWLRANEPHHQVIIRFGDEAAELAVGGWLWRALAFPGAVVASDALFPVDTAGGPPDTDAWPLPPTMVTHPRVAGTFSRSLRLLTGSIGLSWSDALARCTLAPARIMERVAPAMRHKGRVQVGCDADLVAFDPVGLVDRATYTAPLTPSAGMRHVLVAGTALVRDGVLDVSARPGRAIVAG